MKVQQEENVDDHIEDRRGHRTQIWAKLAGWTRQSLSLSKKRSPQQQQIVVGALLISLGLPTIELQLLMVEGIHHFSLLACLAVSGGRHIACDGGLVSLVLQADPVVSQNGEAQLGKMNLRSTDSGFEQLRFAQGTALQLRVHVRDLAVQS